MQNVRVLGCCAMVVLLVGGCGTQVGNAPDLHKKEVLSTVHGKTELVQYTLNLLAAFVTSNLADMMVVHDTEIGKAIAADNADLAVRIERAYQASINALEKQVRDEFDKIDRICLDFDNAFRLGEVVQKALENNGQVDWNRAIDLIGQGAGALAKAGIDLGPLTKALQALSDARKLPKVEPPKLTGN